MMDWFRWHHGSVTDPKFQLVARKSGASLPDVLAVWAFILETSSQSEERGTFGEIDAEALDCLFNFPSSETRTADVLAALRSRGMIDGNRIVSWEKRQPKREREDNSAARVREHRQRKAADGNGEDAQNQPVTANVDNVTPSNANVTQETPRLDKSRLDNKELEQDQKPLHDSLREPAKKSAKGSRLNSDWIPSDAMLAYAAANRPDVNAQAEAENFRDYWIAKPGAGGVKLDWEATWRTWIRRANAGHARASPLVNGKPSAAADFRNTTYTGTPYDELPPELR